MGDRLAVWVTLSALERRRVAAAAAEAAAAAAAAPPPLAPYEQAQAWFAAVVERGRVAVGLPPAAPPPTVAVGATSGGDSEVRTDKETGPVGAAPAASEAAAEQLPPVAAS